MIPKMYNIMGIGPIHQKLLSCKPIASLVWNEKNEKKKWKKKNEKKKNEKKKWKKK